MANMVGDRVAIKTKGKVIRPISTVQIMECSEYIPEVPVPDGCHGNDFGTAMDTLVRNETMLVPWVAYPRKYHTDNYNETNGLKTSDCGTFKADPNGYYITLTDPVRVCKAFKQVGDADHKDNIINMKQHIFNEGPIMAVIQVYQSFMNYDGLTIYEPTKTELEGKDMGNHAIEILGWGVDSSSGMEYWVCCNSWGEGWPAKEKECNGIGYFYVRLGNNTINIEAYSCACTPVVNNIDKAPKEKLTDVIAGSSKRCGTGASIFGLYLTSSDKARIAVIGGIIVLGVVAYYIMKKKK
jgi:hypothetical protein